MENNSKPLKIILQLVNWAAISFSLGVFILFFCLRRWVDYTAKNSASGSHKLLVLTLMILIMVGGYYLSHLLYRQTKKLTSDTKKILMASLPIIVAGANLLWVLSPSAVYGRNVETEMGNRFTIGPYPTKEKIDSLKSAGYTGIISLLSNMVVPFEVYLIKQEETWSNESGLPVIHAPMLPWISDNELAHKIIDSLAKRTTGKYYVHCYLGRDRVGLARRWLEAAIPGKVTLQSSTQRKFEELRKLERGPVWKLGKNAYFIPFPTDEEISGFITNSEYNTVINLLDTTIAESKGRCDHFEQKLLHTGIKVIGLPIKSGQRGEILRKKIAAMQQFSDPMVIIVWNTETPDSQNFLKEWHQLTKEQVVKL